MRDTQFFRCKSTCLWLAFILCGTAASALAESVESSLTLKNALASTLAQNPQLYQYRFNSEVLSAQKQSNVLRPALSLDLEVENFAGSGANKGFDSAETTLALSSVIELGGKRQARASYSDARINRAEWEQQAATLDILGKLTTVYIEGLAIQANLQLANESLALSQSILKTVETRYAQGATAEAEVMRATAALARAEIRVMGLREQFERQKVAIAQFWGETTPAFSSLTGNLFDFGSSQSFDQLYIRVQRSPSLQVLASEARIWEAEIALARAGGRSDLSWRAGIKRFEETGDSALTAVISLPLYAGERSSGAVKAALANRSAVDYAQQELLLVFHTRLFEAWSMRRQSISAVDKIQNVSIPALEKALKLTRQGFDNGRYRYLDLIAAQEELLASKQALIDAATTALLSQALIEQLTGEALSP